MPAVITPIHRFFTQTLWQTRVQDLGYPKRLFFKPLKILLLSVRGFREDNSAMRASALTLYTLLSIVPVTALLFGIAKGFGLEDRLESWLLAQFSGQQEVMKRTVVFARRTLDTAQGGLVAGAGVVLLLYAVLRVIGNIERAFNHIWSVSKSRTWGRKFSDYLSLLLVGPFLILGASSLNVALAAILNRAAETAPLSDLLSPLARLILSATPLLLLWFLFAFLFSFLPNTKVRLGSAAIGGAVTAVLYQLLQTLYINLQVGVTKVNAVYGSFAALPLFIIWLQISWHIVLMGAEVTHQHQNFASNENEEHLPNLSMRAVKCIGLAISHYVAGRYLGGGPPPTLERIGKELDIPSRVLSDILQRLVAAEILSVVAGKEEDVGYQPARDPHQLTTAAILEGLENQGDGLKADGRTAAYSALLDRLDDGLRENPANQVLGSRHFGGPSPGDPNSLSR